MFIYNFKLNGSTIFKLLFSIIIFIVICLCILVAYKIYIASTNNNSSSNEIIKLNSQNYATILQVVHNDIDSYVGKKVSFSGFVYRVYDLNNEQFVLARNMIISSDFQSVIVGFLCQYKDSVKFKDNTWVELEGTIKKGTYHSSDMPIIEVNSITEIEKPNDEYVYPPDENYIPISSTI